MIFSCIFNRYKAGIYSWIHFDRFCAIRARKYWVSLITDFQISGSLPHSEQSWLTINNLNELR